jgi:hypothetical protein
LVISPLVPKGTIYSKPLDHTSILRFLAQSLEKASPILMKWSSAARLSQARL